MAFRVKGLDPVLFNHLYGLSDNELKAHGAVRYVADAKPGFPERVAMRDAEPGEVLLLLNYEHLAVESPYRSSHAIFVREGEERQYDGVDTVPDVMSRRQLSVRAFDAGGMMVDAALINGSEAAETFRNLLSLPKVGFLHVHNAIRGCYSGMVEHA